jgi:hypothetical protein
MIGRLMNMEKLEDWKLVGESEVFWENHLQYYCVHHRPPHDLSKIPGRRGGKPTTNHLSYGTV